MTSNKDHNVNHQLSYLMTELHNLKTTVNSNKVSDRKTFSELAESHQNINKKLTKLQEKTEEIETSLFDQELSKAQINQLHDRMGIMENLIKKSITLKEDDLKSDDIIHVQLTLKVKIKETNDGSLKVFKDTCCICMENYTTQNPTMLLLDCQHKFCKNCSNKVTLCPFDKNVINGWIEMKEHSMGDCIKSVILNPRKHIEYTDLDGNVIKESITLLNKH